MKKIQTLTMKGITKAFNELVANEDIHLTISSGEVLGLLGENGAGKTTLMNILYGLYKPDAGQILINGKEVGIRSPRDSMKAGIGMIHQHFMLVQNHTVLENIALGYESASFFNPLPSVKKDLDLFLNRYGFDLDLEKQIWELSAGEQQKVEILKALFREADLLIMDEPTSVLTPQEAKDLFNIIRRMAAEGHSVILISHKLDEIMEICKRVMVLRKGEVVGKAEVPNITKPELARMMIGREVLFSLDKKPLKRGTEVLKVKDLVVYDDRGLKAVNRISFTIYENEIFGIAGVSGNGQREMVEAITGLRSAEEGRVEIKGADITNHSASDIHARGGSHVPEERIKFGTVANMPIFENAILKQHRSRSFSRMGFLNFQAIRKYTKELVERFQVATPSINLPLKNLSGGNIQKLIVGREIVGKPPLLVAAHPTYGLDVGATEYIRKQLLERREEGGAVLLVSEDLEELFEVCDRIGVMFKGEFMGILDEGHANLKDIGLMMTGSLRLEEESAREIKD